MLLAESGYIYPWIEGRKSYIFDRHSPLLLREFQGDRTTDVHTAMSNQFFNSDMNKPMANLPMVISNFAMNPYEDFSADLRGQAL